MPPKKKVTFEGDAAFINSSLKKQLEERDRKINALENKNVILDQCFRRVYLALEEACGLADRYHQFVQDGMDSGQKEAARTAEMARYSRLFREAKDEFVRSRS
jgi:hypothetical protein